MQTNETSQKLSLKVVTSESFTTSSFGFKSRLQADSARLSSHPEENNFLINFKKNLKSQKTLPRITEHKVENMHANDVMKSIMPIA